MALIKLHQIDFNQTGSYTGSLFGTASYALNGGTTNIYVSGSGSGSVITSSFNNSNTWVFNHNLGTRTPIITVFDSNYDQIIPQEILLNSTSSATIIFPTLESGFVIASVGGILNEENSSFPYTGSAIISGSLVVTGSIESTQGFTGSLFGTSSYSNQSLSSSYALTASYVAFNPSYSTGSFTGSFTGSSNVTSLTAASAVITGNVTILGTASINTLVVNQTQLSTGSNQLGDNIDDFQTLYGTVRIPTGSLTVTGSTNITGSLTVTGGITGSLFGTASYTPTLNQVTTAGNIITNSIIYSGSAEAIKPSVDSVGALGASNFRFGTVYLRGISAVASSLDVIGANINLNDSSGNIKLKVFGSTGNVTIQNGGTHTDNGYKLQLNSSGSASGSLYISGSSSQTLLKVDSPSSSNILFISGSGNVGIGTSNPASQLDLVGQYKQTFVNGVMGLYHISTANANQVRGVWDFYTNTAVSPDFFGRFGFKFEGGTADSFKQYQIHVADQTTPKMVVNGAGSVGIGIPIPNYKLDISGSTFTRKLLVGNDAGFTGNVTSSDYYQRSTTSGTVFIVRDINNNTLFAAAGGSGTGLFYSQAQSIGLGLSAPTAKVQIQGNGSTSTTTTFLIQNSTPTTLMTVLDNGQFTYTTPTMTLAASQSAYVISPIITASNAVGGNYYGVNITPTFYQTTASQNETAFRVAATFTQSSAVATAGTNVIADFGATSVGSQLTVTDITSGSIYMVNDVSGLPIIEATSDWTVNMYNFPNIILQKTGSQVNINGTLKVSGSFVLPLSQSVSPQTGSAYWSGSLLFIWDGTRYRSSSFA